MSIQCLESPTPSTSTTTTTSTTSSVAPGGVEVDPVVPKDMVVSSWDDQMEVAKLKQYTFYTVIMIILLYYYNYQR